MRGTRDHRWRRFMWADRACRRGPPSNADISVLRKQAPPLKIASHRQAELPFLTAAKPSERPCHDPLVTTTAGSLLLNRGTGHRSIGTENATIARPGAQQDATTDAFMEEDAGIRRHRLDRLMAALGTGQRAFQDGSIGTGVHACLPRLTPHHFGTPNGTPLTGAPLG